MSKRVLPFLICLFLFAGTVFTFPVTVVHAASTTDVSLGSTVTIRLSNQNDSKMYRFTVPEAGRVTIDVATNSKAENYSITTTLKDEDGRVLVDPQTGSSFSMPSYGAVAGQTLYLVVESGYRGYDTSFKITFNFSAQVGYEAENNDTSDKANRIYPDAMCHGSISKSDDVDFFTFTIASPQKVKITFGPDVIDKKDRMWDVDLFDSDGESLDCFDTDSKSSRTVSLRKGTYYIRVAGGDAAQELLSDTTAVGGDYYILYGVSSLKIRRPTVTEVKLFGTESWLYDNYATATVSIKNGGDIDGYTFRISRSSNMSSGTKKKNYAISSGNGVTRKKIRSKVRMGIYPKYYVQVRGFVKDAFGHNIYGKFSKIKSGSLSDREYNKLK